MSASGSGTAGTNTVTTNTLTLNTSYSIFAKATDAGSNASLCTYLTGYTQENVAPTVSQVSSTSANGSYKAGAVLPITVTFSEAVVVTGTPVLTLETGVTDAAVNYTSGSGTNVLTFNYTVSAGDTNTALEHVNTASLTLNGGTIKDVAGNDATRTLPVIGANSLSGQKAIVIITDCP